MSSMKRRDASTSASAPADAAAEPEGTGPEWTGSVLPAEWRVGDWARRAWYSGMPMPPRPTLSAVVLSPLAHPILRAAPRDACVARLECLLGIQRAASCDLLSNP